MFQKIQLVFILPLTTEGQQCRSTRNVSKDPGCQGQNHAQTPPARSQRQHSFCDVSVPISSTLKLRCGEAGARGPQRRLHQSSCGAERPAERRGAAGSGCWAGLGRHPGNPLARGGDEPSSSRHRPGCTASSNN